MNKKLTEKELNEDRIRTHIFGIRKYLSLIETTINIREGRICNDIYNKYLDSQVKLFNKIADLVEADLDRLEMEKNK